MREEKGWLTDVGHNSWWTWYVLNMHITAYSKRWDYSDISGGGHKKIKGPTHMDEGGHHLSKAPNPNSQQNEAK